MSEQHVEMAIEIMGTSVPALGFGTWQLTGRECREAVPHALELGYRHIDTAQMYENESEVGEGIVDSGVDRDEVFLVSKLALGKHEADDVSRATRESLERLRTDYLDLMLIHWPDPDVPLEETLGAMRGLKDEGIIRNIGVSNFTPSLVEQAREVTDIFANQVEYHPFLDQSRLLRAVRDNGLLFTAYCPLARGRALEDETIREIADRHDRTPAQVTLRWLIQQRVAAIPKASKAAHREENIRIFDFSLTDDEMRRISGLRGGDRLIDPDWAPRWERAGAVPS